MFPDQIFISRECQERWVNHITRNYTVDLGIHPFVYQVPRSLKDTKPEAYTPQALGLGSYHHFRPDLQQMESQKRAEVKEYLEVAELQKFIDFVKEFERQEESTSSSPPPEQKFQSRIQSFYDRYLDLDSTTLAWILVIDGIFLLHFLDRELKPQDRRLVADILMLENQIPLSVLKEVRIAVTDKFRRAADIELLDQFYRFCSKQSPLKLSDRPQLKKAAFEKHMLHFMYKLIVNNYKDEEGPTEGGSDGEADGEIQQPSSPGLSNKNEVAQPVISKVRDAVGEIVDLVTSGVQQATAQGVKLPGNIDKLLQQLKMTLDLHNKSDNNYYNRLADKIEVPSVSQLHYIAKIKFAITDGGIRNIRFDRSTSTIYLPEITLGENTEVVLRNLVAYEAAAATPEQTLELAEYVDLMCGIIHAEIDVKLLQDFLIIKGNLPIKVIVRIFNGINKSTQWSDKESEAQNKDSEIQKEEFELQKAVREVKKMFNNLRIVKAYKSAEKFCAAFQSWIIRLFPTMVLIFLALQTFCEFYGCSSRRFGYAAVPAASSVIDGSSFGLDAEDKLMLPRKVLCFTG